MDTTDDHLPPSHLRRMGLRQRIKDWAAEGPRGHGSPESTLAGPRSPSRSHGTHTLGGYDARSYPAELGEMLRRREDVTRELMGIDIASRQARVEAIPRLRTLLCSYPHPLVYELLIQAYLDAGRYDEARGAAFAAQSRRLECSSSKYAEIRAEIEHLQAWTPDEIDRMRFERGRQALNR